MEEKTQPRPGLLIETGWRPAQDEATPARRALAHALERLLPSVRHLLWNVRDDLSSVELGEAAVLRLRTLGSGRSWQDVAELERLLALVRDEGPC